MRYKLVILLFILIPISSLQAQNHDPTKASADEVLSHGDLTSATRKVGPPKELIKEWPGTVTITQPRENIIPGARIMHQLGTQRISRVEFHPAIFMPGATTHREAAEEFLSTYHALLGFSSDLSELEFVREDTSNNVSHSFSYQQVYGGLPVKFGSLRMIVMNDLSLHNGAFSLKAITTPPPSEPFNPTNSEQAIKVALRTINAHWIPNPQPIARAQVLVEEGEPRVIWQVTFSTGGDLHKTLESVPQHLWPSYFDMMSWEVLVDADTLRPVAARYLATSW